MTTTIIIVIIIVIIRIINTVDIIVANWTIDINLIKLYFKTNYYFMKMNPRMILKNFQIHQNISQYPYKEILIINI
jgi:hypothetical protein